MRRGGSHDKMIFLSFFHLWKQVKEKKFGGGFFDILFLFIYLFIYFG